MFLVTMKSALGSKENETNLVPEMRLSGLWDELTGAINLVAHHSDNLLYSVNNNCGEAYNSVIAKYVGGKRVNYSLRGSYKTRCNATVISYNYGPDYLHRLHKNATKISPGRFTKKYIEIKKKKRICETRRQKKRKTVSACPDKDYGDVDDIGCSVLNLTDEEVEGKKQNLLNSLQLNLTEIKSLERSRKFRLTASNFGRICALRPKTPRTNTLKYILYSDDLVGTTAAMKYGIQYESVAKDAFETKTKIKISPCGMFVD
ncbi:hypothetical protein QTP88_019403 [Uroleucon formosanum]